MSFSDDLWDSFETVCTRLRQGKEFCVAYSKVYGELAKLSKEYAKAVVALTKGKEVEFGTTNLTWIAVKQDIDNIANTHIKLADDITYRVITPVENHCKETSKTKRKGKENGRKLIESLTESIKNLNAQKAEYEKLMRVLDQTQTEFDRVSNLNELYNSTKLKKKLEQDKKKADSAEKKYRKAVDKAKQLEIKMFDTEMPRILDDFEKIERERLNILKASMGSFSQSYRDFLPQIDKICDNIDRSVEKLDPNADISHFVLEKKTGKNKESQRIEFEAYDTQYKCCMREGANPHSDRPSFGGGATLGAAAGAGAGAALARSGSSAEIASPYGPSSSSPNPYAGGGGGGASSSPYSNPSMSMSSSSLQPAAVAPAAGAAAGGLYASERRMSSAALPVAPAPAPARPAAKGISQCRGLHDYTASQPAELSFRKGEVITVLEKDPSGWWTGELNGKVGFFPSVEWVEEIPGGAGGGGGGGGGVASAPSVGSISAASNPYASSGYGAAPASSGGSNPYAVNPYAAQPAAAAAPVVAAAPAGYSQPPGTVRCKVIYKMDAASPNELSLTEGETLFIESEADGWYFGTNQRGQRGMFPATFVSIER